jgi:hypothetical protein
MKRILFTVCFCIAGQFGFAQNEERQWSDSSGRFKVVGSLVEIKDGNVILQSNGKMMKIPVSRLSKADQDFLNAGDSPFQVMDASESEAVTKSESPPAPSNSGGNGASLWQQNWSIDWDNVPTIDRGFGEKKGFAMPDVAPLELPGKRAILPKKTNFFEDVRTMAVNPIANRTVVGYTVSFSVPKPLSRLSLIDNASGKVINTLPQECDMCPMTLLNDGSTVLMYGTGKDESVGTSDQIQLWKVNGKNVVRSGIWIPFLNESESFRKKTNATVVGAFSTSQNNLLLLSDKGHLACFELVSRKCLWHERLSNNFAFDISADRKLLFVLDGPTIMILDPDTGEVKSTVPFGDQPHIAWPQIAIGPSGKNLLVAFGNEIRVLDLTKGEWTIKDSVMHNGSLTHGGLAFPDEEYGLFSGSLLVHLPTMIKVCTYSDAKSIRVVGPTSYVAVMGNEGGLFAPTKFPHPKAAELLKKAQSDPKVFVVKPGVEVSIDIGAIPSQHQSEVKKNLENAAKQAGYKLVDSAPIRLVAAITGPEQEAVSYHMSGSHIFNKLTSNLRMVWQNKDIWATSGTNVPFMVSGSRDQSFKDSLKAYEGKPNLGVFGSKLPKRVQTPTDDQSNQSGTLMTSKFTPQGLVDSN